MGRSLDVSDDKRMVNRWLSAAPTTRASVAWVELFSWVGGVAVLLAFLCRGDPLLGMAGLRLVDRDGHPLGRVRASWRAIVAWGPSSALAWTGFLFLPYADGWYRFDPDSHAQLLDTRIGGVLMSASALLMVAGVIHTLFRPHRGLHDRIAGSWVVPA